jgi:hypothetical protein
MPVRSSRGHWSGRAFQVHTTSRNGMHDVVAVTAGPPTLAEAAPTLHDVVAVTADPPTPAEATPSDAECAAPRSVTRAMLDLTGHEDGSSDTRVLLTARGPRIAEVRLEAGPASGTGAGSHQGAGGR